MSDPYRSNAVGLHLCPRCGDLLLAVFDVVHACPRCEGVWLPQSVINRAFGDPRWPQGTNAWWRNELECPECAIEGVTNKLNAVSMDNTIVDRCAGHGVWCDQGELRRLLGTKAADLEALHAKLAPGEPIDLTGWRERADEKHRAAQMAAHAARQAAMEAARERRERAIAAEQERLEKEKRDREEQARLAEQKQRDEAAAVRASMQRMLAEAEKEVARLERELVGHRAAVRDCEAALNRARQKMMLARNELIESAPNFE